MRGTASSDISGIQPGTSWAGNFDHSNTCEMLNISERRSFLQRIMEKRWCYVGVFHPDIIFGCAVIHLGYIASAFIFGFDREQNQMTEHTFVFPPMGQARYDRNPEKGICSYRSLAGHLRMSHGLPADTTRINAAFRLPGKKLEANLEMRMPKQGLSPMHFLMPMENDRRAFTTKAAGFDANGTILLNQKRIDLDSPDTFAVLDWTNGFYPRQTFWNWACGAGMGQDNTRIGFNFSAGVYTSGLLENIVWINGVPEKIGAVDFIYDPTDPQKSWQVNSRDNKVKLVFHPEGIRSANDNFGIVKSRFIQPCGAYSGSIRIPGSPEIKFSNIGGVAEEHFAKW